MQRLTSILILVYSEVNESPVKKEVKSLVPAKKEVTVATPPAKKRKMEPVNMPFRTEKGDVTSSSIKKQIAAHKYQVPLAAVVKLM